MESKKIYEESHEELVRISKEISCDSFTINTYKLDNETKGKLLSAINLVLNERKRATEEIILGVQ